MQKEEMKMTIDPRLVEVKIVAFSEAPSQKFAHKSIAPWK